MSRARAPDAGHDADKHAPAARSAPSRPHPASRTALPSPPPSDPPEAAPPAAEDTQQDTDVRAHFDMRDLRQRYTLVRRRVAEVRIPSARPVSPHGSFSRNLASAMSLTDDID